MTKTATDVKKQIEKVVEGFHTGILATIHEGKPWCRYVMARRLDDSLHLYFSTGLNSRKVKDIKKNPAVHYTAMKSNDGTMSPYIQFQGRAVLHTDQETKDRVWVEEFANYFKGREDPNYAVIELIPERIEYMGMDPENWEPDIWEPGM